MKKIIIDDTEMAQFIAEKTGLDLTVIMTVLDVEMEFLKLKGVIKGGH